MRRIASALFGVGALVAASWLAFGMGIFLVLPHAWRAPGDREKYTVPGAVRWAGIVIDHLLQVRVRITGTLPDPQGPRGMLVLSNHRSWLDPLLLIRFTHSNGLSKSEVRWIPFVGWMGRLTGAVFFDRRDPRDRQRARDEVLHLLRCGHRVQVFPEGTRTREERVGRRVYLNLVRDCWHQKIPVLCCSVWRTEAVLPPDFFGAWWGQSVELRVGKLLEPADFPDARTFAAAAWSEVVAGIDEVAALPITRS